MLIAVPCAQIDNLEQRTIDMVSDTALENLWLECGVPNFKANPRLDDIEVDNNSDSYAARLRESTVAEISTLCTEIVDSRLFPST